MSVEEIKQLMRTRPKVGRTKQAKYKWQKQLAKHSDAAASACQKKLRKVPSITAHRPCEGEGCERVTVKSDRTKAEVKIGIDAANVADMRHVCTVLVGGEEVSREEYPIDMEEGELGEKAADLLLGALKLGTPGDTDVGDAEFGPDRVASWA